MNASKRKFEGHLAGRRVRPRREEEVEVDSASEQSSSGSHEELERSLGSSDNDASSDEEFASPGKDGLDASSISFGALARAQASLASKEPSRKVVPPEGETTTSTKATSQPTPKKVKVSRANKNAPLQMSTKRPVPRAATHATRTSKPNFRDPRFDPAVGSTSTPVDGAKARRAYAFLDEYRDSELKDLRQQIKKTKNAEAKAELRRLVMSMESRKKAREDRELEQRVAEEHRRKEKELVGKGKKPFFLKKAEQKKRVLVEKFAGLSEKQVDKRIEKRRKKMASREKRELGQLQRRDRSA